MGTAKLIAIIGLIVVSAASVARAGTAEDLVAALDRGDDAKAWKLARQLADQGDAKAQASLGVMYLNGQGVGRNDAEALKWFHTATQQADAQAQDGLGFMYATGRGVTQDLAKAIQWFQKSAEQGNAQGQYHLASGYAKGQGVPQDDAEAAKWYRKSAEQGYSESQLALGALYAAGKGVSKDAAKAVKWFLRAATQGNGPAQNILGFRYRSGDGVPADPVQAYMWFSLAAVGGDPAFIKARDDYGKGLTDTQRQKAQKLASNWQPTPERTPAGRIYTGSSAEAPFCAVFPYGKNCYYLTRDTCLRAAGISGACVVNSRAGRSN